MKPPQKIWVVIDHLGHIIHQTTDSSHVVYMRRYVEKAKEAGDEWSLVEYSSPTDVSREASEHREAS